MYNALDIAKYIVQRCIKNKKEITNLQLQYILYFISFKVELSEDYKIELFGPCFKDVYYYFCGFGAMPINIMKKQHIKIDKQDKKIIDSAVDFFSNFASYEIMRFNPEK